MGDSKRRQRLDPSYGYNAPYRVEIFEADGKACELYLPIEIEAKQILELRYFQPSKLNQIKDGKASAICLLISKLFSEPTPRVESELRQAIGDSVDELLQFKEDYQLSKFSGRIYAPTGEEIGGFSPDDEEFVREFGEAPRQSTTTEEDYILELIRL